MICFCISIRKIELVVVGVKKAFIAFKHLRNKIKCTGCFVILLQVLGMCSDVVNERKICKFWSLYFSTLGLVGCLMIFYFLCAGGSIRIPCVKTNSKVISWPTGLFSSSPWFEVNLGHQHFFFFCRMYRFSRSWVNDLCFLRHSTCFVFSLDLHEVLNYSCWGFSQYLQRIFICVRIRHILLVHNCVGI
jgi:hypothetical protein